MKKYKVKNEWLVDENNDIIKMTLKEWADYFKITPYKHITENGKEWQTYRSETKKERNGFIDIYKKGGYGLKHNEYNDYMNKIFRTGNADFDIELVEINY